MDLLTIVSELKKERERNARQKVICVFHATFTRPRSFSERCARRLTVVVRVRLTRGDIPASTPLTYKEARKRKMSGIKLKKRFQNPNIRRELNRVLSRFRALVSTVGECIRSRTAASVGLSSVRVCHSQ